MNTEFFGKKYSQLLNEFMTDYGVDKARANEEVSRAVAVFIQPYIESVHEFYGWPLFFSTTASEFHNVDVAARKIKSSYELDSFMMDLHWGMVPEYDDVTSEENDEVQNDALYALSVTRRLSKATF